MDYKYTSPKKLGFGAMRLPTVDGVIDHEQVCQMVDMFLGRGFTYFDTAYVYHGGKSEVALREALVKRYPRDSFTVATKLPAWEIKEQADVERLFNEQLERLGVDYIDFYLLHNVNGSTLPIFDDNDCWTWLAGLKEKGLAKRVGFSFHDSAAKLDEVLTAHPFVDFVQLQINYIDWKSEKVDSEGVYEVAARHGKRVIVMEPVKGGLLAQLPAEANAALAEAGTGSPASFAVRYAASLENVLVTLSGMSTLAQMEDNSSYMEEFKPLCDAERAAIAKVVDILNAVPTAPCTACKYCVEGCPMGIRIPNMISVLNEMRRYGVNEKTMGSYKFAKGDGADAGDCIGCGQCETACPQHLEIPALLAELTQKLASYKA